MKKLTLFGSLIMVLTALGFGVSQLRLQERNLITLKCESEIYKDKEKKALTSYFKVTKRLFEDHPHKLYISNPDYDEVNSPPNLIGVSVQNASKSDLANLKSQLHNPPDWYTFIPERKDKKIFLPVATYINRITLQMDDLDIEDGKYWTSSSCVIVQSTDFDEDWKTQVEKKKKEQQF